MPGHTEPFPVPTVGGHGPPRYPHRAGEEEAYLREAEAEAPAAEAEATEPSSSRPIGSSASTWHFSATAVGDVAGRRLGEKRPWWTTWAGRLRGAARGGQGRLRPSARSRRAGGHQGEVARGPRREKDAKGCQARARGYAAAA